MDFEFSMLDRTNIVLISGAMSNSLDRFRTIKIEGIPLLLTKTKQVKQMSEKEVIRAIREICRIFKDKEELLFPVLRQMKQSINSKESNLNMKSIKKYLGKNGTEPVVVFWNGSTDKEIMERLNLGNYKMLELTSYDVFNNHIFFLQLKNMKTKQIIGQEEIGYADKNGRLLKLVETHELICNRDHAITYAHDPCTDVILTKCLFDKVIRVCNRKNININDYV